MTDPIQFLTEHGYTVVFVLVLADQIGVPVPSFPVVLAAGAMAGAGHLHPLLVLALASAGAFLSDAIWYELGRYRGARVLRLLCRLSLEPDVCVRMTEASFHRHGWRSLLVSKFVPWLNVVASPVAGMIGMARLTFWFWNGLGAVLWAGVLVGGGYLLRDELERTRAFLALPGQWLFAGAFALLASYLAVKYFRRRRMIRQLRIPRITPQELKRRIEEGETLAIIDLRSDREFGDCPQTLPGAVRLVPSQVARRHGEIPADRELVLYCGCPDEGSSAQSALRLLRSGRLRVRPLAGGLDGWLRLTERDPANNPANARKDSAGSTKGR